MCFSASASFGVSAILLIGGAITLKKTKSFSQIPFASIPLLFAIQQFTEGFVWLSLTNETYAIWNHNSTMVFIIFAQVVWPSYVPFSIWLLEKNPIRKKILGLISIFGLLLSLYLLYCILNFSAESKVSGSHILYHLGYRQTSLKLNGVFYLIPTVLPALISSYKRMIYFGLTILVSLIVSQLLFPLYLISVWCYFAAALSILIYWIIGSANKTR